MDPHFLQTSDSEDEFFDALSSFDGACEEDIFFDARVVLFSQQVRVLSYTSPIGTDRKRRMQSFKSGMKRLGRILKPCCLRNSHPPLLDVFPNKEVTFVALKD